MRLVLLPVLLTAALAGCTDHGPSPSPEPDKVYIWPQFVEPVSAELIPQLFPGDWTLEGTTGDRQGQWALAGSPLVVRVHSPLYEPLEVALVVPDTVSANDDGTRWYRPAIAVQRVVPALLSAEWTADFTGPTIRLEIYAPNGLAGVRLTSTWVYYQACLEGTPFPCDVMINGSSHGAPWADPAATGLRGWAELKGPWWDWPTALPPPGYEGEVGLRGWGTMLNVNIADDHGHVGHGACGGGFIPSDGRTLGCGVLYTQ